MSDSIEESKFNFKKLVLNFLLMFLILSPLLLYVSLAPLFFKMDPIEKQPWISWFNDPYKRVYISWETNDNTKGIIYYGTSKDSLTSSKFEVESKTLHHEILDNLLPNTKYYYKVEINGELFGTGEFKTAPLTYEDFTWVMISDTQQHVGPGHHYRTARVIDQNNEDYAFIANVGDLVDDGYDQALWNNFFTIAHQYFDTIPFVPVIGNHDTHRPTIFTNYFINQVNSSDEFFYSFNYGSVHFQILYIPYGHLYELSSVQMRWMEEDLKAAQDMPFRVVMFHCPIIGASMFGRNENLETYLLPTLLKYNVDATIHGHEHHFERGHIDNMMYMILGGGGGMLDAGLCPLPETDVLTATPCYTEVHATASSLTFTTLTLEGALIDNYTILKTGGI